MKNQAEEGMKICCFSLVPYPLVSSSSIVNASHV